MKANFKYVNIILHLLVYILSFYCFASTNMFKSFTILTGSIFIPALIVNVVSALLLLCCMAVRKNLLYCVSVISLVLLFPAVFSVSRLDWFEKIFGVSFKADAPSGLIAIAVYLTIVELIFGRKLVQLQKWSMQMMDRGAEEKEVASASENQMAMFSYIALFISGPAVLVILIGFFALNFPSEGFEPALFLVLGAAVAAVSLVVYMVSVYKKKS